MKKTSDTATRLDAICPYFTRFPLHFPLRALRRARPGQWALDPFCGCGAALFAARLCGLGAVGIDSNPVATVIARAKLQHTTASAVMARAVAILKKPRRPKTPPGPFWELCFAPDTLRALCSCRAHFRNNLEDPVDIVLCAVLMGLLHGPGKGGSPLFLSNLLSAGFAPAPEEALAVWRREKTHAPDCDVLEMISRRAQFLFAGQPAKNRGIIYTADSRTFSIADREWCDWVITSPPYYGLTSYCSDQWLRRWLMGGPTAPGRELDRQICPQTPADYVAELARVWKNIAGACRPGARLAARIGNVPGIAAPPAAELFKESLRTAHCGWRVLTRHAVCDMPQRPQRRSFFSPPAPWPENEAEIHARLEP